MGIDLPAHPRPAHDVLIPHYSRLVILQPYGRVFVLRADPMRGIVMYRSAVRTALFAMLVMLGVLAPLGVSTESEASAGDVAKLIDQIKRERVKVYFVETSNDPRLVRQVAAATGAEPGGELYVESLSEAEGPADTYAKMFRTNVDRLVAAMAK